jgi:hypothetical protein
VDEEEEEEEEEEGGWAEGGVMRMSRSEYQLGVG